MTLYTRKKRHGTKTPRVIPITNRLKAILEKRNIDRNPDIPWVFWHKYFSKIQDKIIIGKYNDRKKFMKSLCRKAGVEYFRFHPIRHSGATFMEGLNIPISSIQNILGHENRKTTERYIHSINDMNKEIMKIYEHEQLNIK